MGIFEFWNEKGRKMPNSAVEDFKEDSELEKIVKEYAELSSKSAAMSADKDAFSEQEVKETRGRLLQIEHDHGESLQKYLEPYRNLLNYGKYDWHRWYVARALKHAK